jgi:hypothetical protein
MLIRKGLYHEAAGAPAGGAPAAGAVADLPAGTTTPASGNGTPPNPQVGGAPPASKFDWTSLKLDPDLQAVVDRHQFADPSVVVKSFANAEKLMGLPPDRIVKMPTDKSTPDEWNEYYTKLGRPAKAEDYKLPVPDGDTGEFAKTASSWMHEAGVPQGMATKIATKWNEHVAGQMKAAKTAADTKNATEGAELKTEWGADYEKNFQLVDRAAQEFGMTKQHLDALRSSLGVKEAMKFMQKIGAKVGAEGEFVDTDKGSGNFNQNLTPETARAQLTALMKDPAHVQMFNSKDPKTRQEARANQRRLELLASPGSVAYPGPAR